MDKHYTLMIIPEKDKGVKSFKVPGILVRSIAFITVATSFLLGILLYDYWQILQQIHENKHLSLENRQLREQIQLFQMKVNSLADDFQRISTFEQKMRIITGLEDATKTLPIMPTDEDMPGKMMDDHGSESLKKPKTEAIDSVKLNQRLQESLLNIESQPEYTKLRKLYDQKIAANLGLSGKYKITRKFSDLIKNSLELSNQYASFDYKFKEIKKFTTKLEEQVHGLDQYILNRESVLRSTPTIFPATGWITSYFGHRISPTLGRLKMHEGLDVGAPFGTPIYASADGIVNFAGKKAGFGFFVQIDHGYGIETLYAHAQKLETEDGNKVKRGDLIARVGSTGASTGPHLHYEVRVNGIAVDPLYFVLN